MQHNQHLLLVLMAGFVPAVLVAMYYVTGGPRRHQR